MYVCFGDGGDDRDSNWMLVERNNEPIFFVNNNSVHVLALIGFVNDYTGGF